MRDHPQPEVEARKAVESEIPRGANQVLRNMGPGWTFQATYARGTSLSRSGQPGPVVDSLALRFQGDDGRRAVAVWTDGKFERAYLWDDDGLRSLNFRAVTSAAVKAEIGSAS